MGDDIRNYLPELYEGIQDKITISNLLTHTSGIRDVYELWGLKGQTWWELFIDNADAIELKESIQTISGWNSFGIKTGCISINSS